MISSSHPLDVLFMQLTLRCTITHHASQGKEEGEGEEDAAEERSKSKKRADANPFRSLAEEVEEELKREARDKKEQGEGAGKEHDDQQDEAGGAKDADMHEYVREDEKSDAVAAGAATDEQRAEQMEKAGDDEGQGGKDDDGEGEGDEEGGDGEDKGGDKNGDDEGGGSDGEEDAAADKSWRFSKSAKPKAVAPAAEEDKEEQDEEMVDATAEEMARSEEEEAARRRADADRQALLEANEAIATNVNQLAQVCVRPACCVAVCLYCTRCRRVDTQIQTRTRTYKSAHTVLPVALHSVFTSPSLRGHRADAQSWCQQSLSLYQTGKCLQASQGQGDVDSS